MRRCRGVVLGVLLLVVAACSPGVAMPAPGPPPPVTSAAEAPPPTSPAQAAVDAGAAAVTADDVNVGIAVLDRRTGTLATNDAGAEPFDSASLSKVLTVLDALTGPTAATDADRQRIAAALGPSDDEAMNVLWSRFGGEAGIDRVVERLDLQDTTAPADPSQWGEVQLSARDMVRVLDAVATDGLVLEGLRAAPERATDGFDQAFGLLDPERRGDAAAKQGWLCCLDNRVALHSAGFPDASGRYAVAILSQQPRGYPAAQEVLDEVAAAVRDGLGV